MIKNIIKKSKIRFFWITLERFPNLFRPSSKPYLSGDTLRNFSDHIFDESKSIDPKNIKNKDIVFVNTDVIDIFFKTIFQEIKNDFVLITHNSDVNIESSHLEIIDSRVIHWFAQNLNIENKEKVSLIPIGLENLRRLKHGRRKWFSDPKKEKTKFILSSFNEFTNYKKRGEINSTFRDNNLIDVKKYEKVEDYFSNLQDYRFIILAYYDISINLFLVMLPTFVLLLNYHLKYLVQVMVLLPLLHDQVRLSFQGRLLLLPPSLGS